MDELKEYLRFPDLEIATAYASALEKHNIPFILDDPSKRYDVVGYNFTPDNEIILKIREEDFSAAEKIFETEIDQDLKNKSQEHYLYTFSDKDILGILTNQNEWTTEEVAIATEIAKARNLETLRQEDKPGSFPDKPEIKKTENPVLKSFLSILLFIGAYYVLFSKDLSYILVLVLVLFIHEMGHFLAMKYYKYADLKMFFIPLLGALVTGEKQMISQRQRAVIILAGPVPGIIIGIILYKMGIQNNDYFLTKTGNIFIFLNCFNLLPLTPLDGGNLIATLFFFSRQILQTIFLVISALLFAILVYYLEAYFLLIIPFFMLSSLAQRGKIKKIKAGLDEDGINYNKPYEELSNEEYWLIRDEVIANMSIFSSIKPKEYIVSDKEKMIINQVKLLYTNPIVQDLSGVAKVLLTLAWILFLAGPFVIQALIKQNAF